MLPSLGIILKHRNGLKRCHTLDGTRRSARGPPEDHALSNTDWGLNRAKIGISGKKQARLCHQNTYLPGLYGQGPLKGPIAQELFGPRKHVTLLVSQPCIGSERGRRVGSVST